MFKLSSIPLEELNLKSTMLTSEAGAFASFEGWVRDQSDGRKVVSLDYEAFDNMAGKEAEKILQEAKLMFNVINVQCAHRVGKLSIGDMAVWVGVTAAHRDSAFSACRYVIDELKKRVPIWKKEYYQDGESAWIGVKNYAEQR